MSGDFDVVVRGGLVVDGTGSDPFEADVATAGGRIAAIGRVSGRAPTETDARNMVVTPGFVDIHTHYDGQVTWENRCVPSSAHGVTTVVMGNCGVGFAPCRPDQHDLLIRLMEGVEDIPHPVLVDGLPWAWETYPQYLDYLASRRYDMDICGYIPHAPVRVYVMGERGPIAAGHCRRSPPDGEYRPRSGRGRRHGLQHVADVLPSLERRQVHAQLRGGRGGADGARRWRCATRTPARCSSSRTSTTRRPYSRLLRRMVERAGRPLSVSLLEGTYGPMTLRWREILDWAAQAGADGLPIKAQVLSRAIGVMLGHELTLNTFYTCPTYVAMAGLPFEEKVRRLGRTDVRARILAEAADPILQSFLAGSRGSSTTCSSSAIRRTTSSPSSRASPSKPGGGELPRRNSPTISCWSGAVATIFT